MSTLYLIRHGRAAAAWDVDPDPGLDALGHEQARAAAQALLPHGAMNVVSSPMARARETALPFSQAWQVEPRVEPRISEIPSPTPDLAARGEWLRELAVRDWSTLEAPLWDWRRGVLAALAETAADTVFLTHFMVINAVLAEVLGEERVVNFRPDYCSITVLRNDGGRLSLVQRGAEASTRVL
jgi:broad specificity phosphatase PhoE